MVSLPGVPEETLKTSLYPTSATAAFAFNGSYRQMTSMTFGTGYWLKYAASQPISVVAQDAAQCIIPVRAGWNMIGALSYPAPVTALKPVPPVSIVSKLFGYSAGSGYSGAIMFTPGKAYWVKVSADGYLNLTAESAPPPPSSIGMLADAGHEEERSTPAAELRRLEFTDAGGSRRELHFGASGREVDLSAYELPPIPPAGTFDARFATGRNVEIITRSTSKDVPIHISATHYPVTVRWSGQPGGRSALILDGKALALSSAGRVQIPNEEARVTLRLSPDRSPELPKEYSIDQNYPNPFNPTTTIRYRIPVASRVTIRIYSILGQLVHTLFDGIESEGDKSLEWDASSFGSGTYFCRLMAVSISDPARSFTDIRKMMLVK